MAKRRAILVTKNNSVPSAPFTGATLLQGEAIVNTADGILMFSGVTQSTSEWTPAGTGATANFFEVGSNLYDLRLRHRITQYENISGAGLVNKFLSGTTNGFVLADISTIVGVDTYVTAFTYNNNVLTIKQNVGQPDRSVVINTMTGLTINGNFTVTGSSIFNNVTISGTGLYTNIATGSSANEIVNYATLTSYTQNTDVYVTGNTYTGSTNNTNNTTFGLLYHGTPLNGPYTLTAKDTYTTGGTYNNTSKLISFLRNDSTTGYTVDLSTIDTNDTYVTGGTATGITNNTNIGAIGLRYNQDVLPGTYSLPYTDTYITGTTWTPNILTSRRNDGAIINTTIDTFSALTITNNLNVGGDAIIQGSLTVFGSAISAFTTQLYVEDNNISLNYNPTGSTTVTSICAGWTVQDGNGLVGGDVFYNIQPMNAFTGITSGNTPSISEYTGANGFTNRGWFTQLNDIVIRSTDTVCPGTPNGVRVLAEFDILDGGQY